MSNNCQVDDNEDFCWGANSGDLLHYDDFLMWDEVVFPYIP